MTNGRRARHHADELSRQAEADLRCVALYATTIADTLMLTRYDGDPADLRRPPRSWLVDTHTTATAVERLLHRSAATLDRDLALTTQDVASRIRRRSQVGH